MKRMLVPGLVVLAFAAALVGAWWFLKGSDSGGGYRHASLDAMETKGVPPFTLPNLKGDSVELSSIEGEVLILNFWASWCAPCVEEFPSMMELVDQFDGRVKFVAISEDQNREDMDAFLKAFDAASNKNVILLWDGDRKVANSYGVDRLPETFLVDSENRLIRKVAGTMDWMAPSVVSYISSLTSAGASDADEN